MSKQLTSADCERLAVQYLEKNDAPTSQAYALLGILQVLSSPQPSEVDSLREEVAAYREDNLRLLEIANAAASFFSFPSDGKFELCIKLLDEWDAFAAGEKE